MTRYPAASSLAGGLALVALALMVLPSSAEAQILKKVKKTVARAAEGEAMREIDRMTRDKVRCVFDDLECIRKADESGKGSVLTDDEGAILVDENGKPVTDPDKAAALTSQDTMALKPGEGAWANYEFRPGDVILLYEDFTTDRVGDFPRRFELVDGNWEVIEWGGQRLLRATAGGSLAIPLPKTLPDRFTLEFAISVQHGNGLARFMTGNAFYGSDRSYQGSAITVQLGKAGLVAIAKTGPTAMTRLQAKVDEEVVPVRIMADGDFMKMYVREQRVANAPNAVFPRADALVLEVRSASERTPILLGPVRIAEGGPDLYERLTEDGRAATQGILFATNSDRLRPESTPTLDEIGTMLTDHPELRIAIEGHTDGDGDAEYNQTLSERRAAAVKRFLMDAYDLDGSRMETAGYGESRPAADNASPEGKQQNRRVELVRL